MTRHLRSRHRKKIDSRASFTFEIQSWYVLFLVGIRRTSSGRSSGNSRYDEAVRLAALLSGCSREASRCCEADT